MGDGDAYLLGSCMFARELVTHYVKQHGGKYFYAHQPYQPDFRPMPERIYPTDIWGSTMGWQVDGPIYERGYLREHQSANRWVRFHDPDTGRFYRDHLADEVREELDWYTEAARRNVSGLYRRGTYTGWLKSDSAHTTTSLARLRSFLLGEKYAELSKVVPIANYRGQSGAGAVAVGYAYLRSMAPVAHERLVPKDTSPSPFVHALQRKGLDDHVGTVQSVSGALSITPRWHRWPMPSAPRGAGKDRTFGTIAGGDFDGMVAGKEGGGWISYGCHVSWADAVKPRKLAGANSILAAQEQTPVMLIGPFANANDVEIVEKAFHPEEGYQPGAKYEGTFGPVSWKRASLGRNRVIDAKKLLFAEDQSQFNTIVYVQQYVFSPREMDAWLMVGGYGGAQGWIDGRRVISVNGRHVGFQADRSRGLGRLRKGWNRVLVKVSCPQRREFRVQFRLTHLDRGPIPGLKFAAEPGR